MMRSVLLSTAFAVLAVCAFAQESAPQSTAWRIVAKVAGCPSFAASKEGAADRNIELTPEFRQHLLAMVTAQALEEPQCWYQMPDSDLLLRAGQYCGWPTEVRFHLSTGGWVLLSVAKQYIQCESRDVH